MIKTVEWLKENLKMENLVILDSSFPHMKERSVRIPGARFFNLQGAFSDRESRYPNTMPSEQQFQEQARLLGVNRDSVIVVYDNLGLYTAARAWYMFRSMGHEEVFVLDGGLPAWEVGGGKVEEVTKDEKLEGNFVANYDSSFFCGMEHVEKHKEAVVDARSIGRFRGVDPEPRAELQSGCIKGSSNLPYTAVIDEGKFKSAEELRKILPLDKDVIFSCGSGITACILMLASEITGSTGNRCIYDGSWTEWAMRHELFVE